MILKSFGCSLIYGTDLADDGRDNICPNPSNFTWPALVAKSLGMDYQCHAHGGSGNLQILEKILRHTANRDRALYVIGWSFIDRFDYTQPTITEYPWEYWRTLTPITEGKTAQVYYRDLHSEYKDKLQTLVYIKTAIEMIKLSRSPCVMTCIDDLVMCDKHNVTAAVLDLQQQIKPYLTDFEGRNFIDYSRHHGFEISPTLHPLETAHAAAADVILPHVQALLNNKNNLS